MLEALCRQSSTTLDIVHAEDGPPITQRTSGLDNMATPEKSKESIKKKSEEALRFGLYGVTVTWGPAIRALVEWALGKHAACDPQVTKRSFGVGHGHARGG
jgi:hypothetical protein